MATIKWSGSVVYILDFAFGHTNITSVTFPSTLQRIGLGAFAFSSLSTVTFTQSSTPLYLEARCFEGTKIQTIEFPSNVNWDMNKGEGYVNGTNTLTKIVLNTDYVPKSLARDCIALTSVLASKAQYVLNNAFYNCKSLSTITLLSTITRIHDYAFAYCESLVYDIPQTSLSVGNYSFAYCSSLRLSTIPSTWLVGSYAFIGCSNITQLNIQGDISNSVGLFQGCTGLTSLTLKTSKVPSYCFANCSSLASITFAQNQIFLEDYSFVSTGPLTNLNLTTVSQYANAFQYSKVVSVIIYGNTYCELAFLGCMDLKTITLSKDSTWMDATMAINTSDSLNIVSDVENTAFQIKNDMVTGFSNIFALLPTYTSKSFTIPAGILYLNKGFLSLAPKVKTIIVENDGLRIQDYAFIYCWAIQKVTINKCMNKELSARMFKDDFSLKELSIPSKITKIGERCFHNNYNLKKITFSGTIVSIGAKAFCGCYALQSFDYSKVTQIPTECFRYCYKLKSVLFSNSLRMIDTYAFDNSGISSAEVPDSCFDIRDYAFSNCANLKLFTIGKGITRLPSYMLYNSPLTTFSITSNVKYIDVNAFSGARKLSVTVEETNP